VIEKAKFLKHNAYSTPDRRKPVVAQAPDILSEDFQVAPGWLERQKQKLQERGFPSTRGARQEEEVAWQH
jgi:hypothetical protein